MIGHGYGYRVIDSDRLISVKEQHRESDDMRGITDCMIFTKIGKTDNEKHREDKK